MVVLLVLALLPLNGTAVGPKTFAAVPLAPHVPVERGPNSVNVTLPVGLDAPERVNLSFGSRSCAVVAVGCTGVTREFSPVVLQAVRGTGKIEPGTPLYSTRQRYVPADETVIAGEV